MPAPLQKGEQRRVAAARMQALKHMFEASKTGPPLEEGVPAVVASEHQEQAQRVSDLASKLKRMHTTVPIWNQHGLKLNTKQVCKVLEQAPCVLVGVINSTESDRKTGWERFVEIFKKQHGTGLPTVAISQVVSPDEAADATARLSEAFALVVQKAQQGAMNPIALKVCHELCSTHRAPRTKLFLSVSLKRSNPQSSAIKLTPLWEVDASLFSAQAGSFEKRGVHIDPNDPTQGMASEEYEKFVRGKDYMVRIADAEREDPNGDKSRLTERLTKWVTGKNELFKKAHSIPLNLVTSIDEQAAFEQARKAFGEEHAEV